MPPRSDIYDRCAGGSALSNVTWEACLYAFPWAYYLNDEPVILTVPEIADHGRNRSASTQMLCVSRCRM